VSSEAVSAALIERLRTYDAISEEDIETIRSLAIFVTVLDEGEFRELADFEDRYLHRSPAL
jgi:ABC-type uncharacterized transport system ATPase subunit